MDAPATPSARELLRRRGVVPLILTTMLSSTAAVAQVTALGKLVYDLTGSDLALGLLGLAEFLPAVALVGLTGSLADRFDRRRIVMLGLLGETLATGGIAWHVHSDAASTGPVFALVVLFGVGRAFVAPALRALPPDIAPPGGLPRLIAFNSAGWQVALIGGPILAGFLYVVTPTWPFVATMALSATGALTILTVRLPRDGHPAPVSGETASAALIDLGDELRAGETLDALGEEQAGLLEPPAPASGRARFREAFEGLRVVRRDPILLGAISLDLFAVLFGGAVALLPAIAETQLGVGAVGLGWLRAATGIGAAITTVALSIRPLRRHVGRVLLLVVGLFGAATVVLGVTGSFALAFLALLVLSGADAVSVFVRSTLVPLVAPDESRDG